MSFDWANTLAASPFVALVFATISVWAFATERVVSGPTYRRSADALAKREEADDRVMASINAASRATERLAAMLEGFLRGSSR